MNILTGLTAELVPWLAGHMDVNAIDVTGVPADQLAEVERARRRERETGASRARDVDPFSDDGAEPVRDHGASMEFKTVWHPIGA